MRIEKKTHSSGARAAKNSAAKEGSKKRLFRLAGIILVVVMCFGLVQTGAFAQEEQDDANAAQAQLMLPEESDAMRVSDETEPEIGPIIPEDPEVSAQPESEPEQKTAQIEAEPPTADDNAPTAMAIVEEYSSDDVAITFADQHGLVIDTKIIRQDEVVPRTDKIPTPPVGKTFLYWTLDDGTEKEFVFGTATASGDMTFVPVFSGAHYVHFEADGSESAFDPAFVTEGDAAAKPEGDPVRIGYAFLWWSLEKNGTAYDFATPVTAPMTLHAVWEAQPVRYSVVSWLEKPNIPVGTVLVWPRDYTSYKVAEGFAPAGITVSDVAQIDSKLLPATDELIFFEYGRTIPATLKGNGQSVVNVLYNRSVYTQQFALSDSAPISGTVEWNWFGGSPWENKTFENPGTQVVYQFQAKYEQDVSGLWPSLGVNTSMTSYSAYADRQLAAAQPDSWQSAAARIGSSNVTTKRISLSADMIPLFSKTITWYPTYSTNMVRYDVNYWTEPLPGQSLTDAPAGSVQSYAGRTYLKNETLSQTLYTNQATFSGKNIDGMELRASTNTAQADGFIYDFYYGRKPVNIQYQTNGGSVIAAKSNVLHGERIAGHRPQDPQRANAIFEGWYYDDAFQNPVDWQNDIVSASAHRGLTPTVVETVTLYAKWQATDYTVSFYERKSGIGETQPIDVKFAGSGAYMDLSQPIVMTVSGKRYPLTEGVQVPGYGSFLGWYFVTDAGNTGGSFSDLIAIKRSYDVYAHWRTDGFRVTYEKGDAAAGIAPVDPSTYMLGTQTRVQESTDGMTAGTLVFAGWRSDLDGRLYRPGQLMTIKGDTVLNAVWRARERLTFTAASGTKEYDGTPFMAANATLTQGTLFETDTFRVKMTPESSITEPGTRPNVIQSVVILRGGTDVTNEYDFAPFADGILRITPKAANEPSKGDQTPDNSTNVPPTTPSGPSGGGTAAETPSMPDNNGSAEKTPSEPDDNGITQNTAQTQPKSVKTTPQQTAASAENPAAAQDGTGTDFAVAIDAPEARTDDATSVAQVFEDAGMSESINDSGIPLAGAAASWSLADLLLMILSAVVSLSAGIVWLSGRKKKEDARRRKTGLMTVAGIAVAIVSAVVFLLTQDMRLPVAWFDRWTLLMAVFAAINVAVTMMCVKRYKKNTEDKQAAMAG